MSAVQLSSGAAAETPCARRGAPRRGRGGACRSLFGPVDHDELDRDMESKLSEMCALDRRRWNFDFRTNTPLRGGYKWEPLGAHEMPAFYRECVRRQQHQQQQQQPRDAGSRRAEGAVHGGCPATLRLSAPEAVRPKENMNSENVGRKTGPRRAPKRRESAGVGSTSASTTRMTDYYAKRRRTSTAKPVAPAAQVAVEKTPYRRIR